MGQGDRFAPSQQEPARVRRVARFLSVGAAAFAVLGLSKVHARWVADTPYSFTGSFRFSWALGYIVLLIAADYAFGLPDHPRSLRQALTAALSAAGVAALGVSVLQLLVGDALLPRFVVFGTVLVVVPMQILANAMARHGRSRAEGRDRVLLVASPQERERLVDDLRQEPEQAASLVASLTPVEAAGAEPGDRPVALAQIASRATVVVLDRHAQADDRIIAQAAALHEAGVRVRTLQTFYEDWLGKLPLSELERASMFFDIGEVHRARYTRMKRLMDVALALVGLVALVLATPVVVVGDLVANRGPLMYRQTRVGKGGRRFTIRKFRTMRPDGRTDGPTDAAGGVDTVAPGGGEWTATHDPRVTPFGRLLRRSHLDELPQVINILRGDLSVVGPRPKQPHYVAELSDKLAFYDMRHLVRPGLTGWAQVKYGYAGDERDALEKLQYEFFYLRHQDLRFDQRIIVRTVRSLVGGQGSGR
jgi:lipopolysaccharide/colanic/teichoic acid biosynthesis glycosyltransferase